MIAQLDVCVEAMVGMDADHCAQEVVFLARLVKERLLFMKRLLDLPTANVF